MDVGFAILSIFMLAGAAFFVVGGRSLAAERKKDKALGFRTDAALITFEILVYLAAVVFLYLALGIAGMAVE